MVLILSVLILEIIKKYKNEIEIANKR